MTDANELVRHYNPTTRIIEHVTLAYAAANGLIRFDGEDDEVEVDKTIVSGNYPEGALVAVLSTKEQLIERAQAVGAPTKGSKAKIAEETQHAVMSGDPVTLEVADEELHRDSRG